MYSYVFRRINTNYVYVKRVSRNWQTRLALVVAIVAVACLIAADAAAATAAVAGSCCCFATHTHEIWETIRKPMSKYI